MLSVDNIKAGYRRQDVLKGISFSVEPGKILGVLGPNGAGKSTLVKVLLGSLPLKAGKIEWCNQNIFELSAQQKAQCMAWVGPEPVPDMQQRVSDILALGRYAYTQGLGFLTQEDINIIQEVAQQFKIAAQLNLPYAQLSSGQQQWVQIARAFVQQPDLLILDEPATHLDFLHQETLDTFLKQFVGNGGCVLMISHDVKALQSCVDDVVLIKEGNVVERGAAQLLSQSDQLRRLFV